MSTDIRNQFFVAAALLAMVKTAITISAEERLILKLFDENRYDKRVRPVEDSDRPVNVSFRLDFNQLYDVNEKTQTVVILTDVYEQWYEPRLFWNVSEYGNLTSFTVDGSLIWTPDTTLYNGVEMYRPSVEDSSRAVVTTLPALNTSLINYFYNGRHAVGCRFDVRFFPFDTQNCTFSFGSWSSDGSMINYYLQSDSATTEYHQESNVWSLISFAMSRESLKFEVSQSPFTVINAYLVIKRRPLYYLFNLIMPTLLINVLSSFALFASEGSPENRHDKLEIGITTLLSYCILLLSVSDQVPKGSATVPLLGAFYVAMLLQNTLLLFLSIYMSFPDRRRKIAVVCKKLTMRLAWHKKPQIRPGQSADQIKKDEIMENEVDHDGNSRDDDICPEHMCMWAGFVSTVIITAAVFAVGLTA